MATPTSITVKHINVCNTMTLVQAVYNHITINGWTKNILWRQVAAQVQIQTQTQTHRAAATNRISNDVKPKIIKPLNRVHVHCVHVSIRIYQICGSICVSYTIQHQCVVHYAKNPSHLIYIWSDTIYRCMAVRYPHKYRINNRTRLIRLSNSYKVHKIRRSNRVNKHRSHRNRLIFNVFQFKCIEVETSITKTFLCLSDSVKCKTGTTTAYRRPETCESHQFNAISFVHHNETRIHRFAYKQRTTIQHKCSYGGWKTANATIDTMGIRFK